MRDGMPAPPSAVQRPKRPSTWVFSGLVLLALVGALVTYKASGSLRTITKVQETHALTPKGEVIATAPLPAQVRPFARTFNYLAIVWPALVFGVLIGAAVRALIPSSWLARLLGGPPVRSQMLGGLAGAPLMLCSCCIAPVFAAVHERTRKAGPASALLLAAPALNPAALALTFMLFAPGIALTRLALAIVLVFGVSALAARYVGTVGPAATECAIEAQDGGGPGLALRAFARETLRLSVTTLPLILLGVVLSSILVDVVPVSSLAGGAAGIAVILLVAFVGVLIALPTFAEIPLALGLLGAGAPAGAALALLVAGPAINLPSLFTLRRMTGTRYALALGAGTFLVAALGGLAVG